MAPANEKGPRTKHPEIMNQETRHPEPANSKRSLPAIAKQFMERRRKGEKITPEEFARNYPQHEKALLDFLPAVLIGEYVTRVDPNELADLKSDATLPLVQDEKFPKIPDYLIFREIGRGGMGVVYEAEQLSLRRRVALKVLPSTQSKNDVAIQRFQREACSAAGLHHTNIVPVYDVGESNGNYYYAMQYIVGDGVDKIIKSLVELQRHSEPDSQPNGEPSSDDLMFVVQSQIQNRNSIFEDDTRSIVASSTATKLRSENDTDDSIQISGHSETGTRAQTQSSNGGSGQTKESDGITKNGTTENSTIVKNRSYFQNIARVGFDVASALSYAHKKEIIHRDIKPSNLLIDVDGNLWVADFGLAKTIDDELTQTGNIVGTFRYMAPERFQGVNTFAGDIYALGATLYELVALRPAFTSTDHMPLIDRIKNESPTPLRSLVPSVPIDLETIISKSMEKDPLRRYASAEELADDLDCFIKGKPISARRVTLMERLGLWARNNKAIAALLAILFLGMVATTCGTAWAAVTYRNMAKEQTELAKVAETSATRHRHITDLFINSFGKARADRDGQTVTVYESLTDSLGEIRELQDEDPLTSAALLASVARVFESLGIYDDYHQLSKEARDICLTHVGRDHQDTIQYGIQVARGLTHLGREDETFELLLDLTSDVSEEEQRLEIASLVGESLIKQQKAEEAIQILESALIDCEISDEDSLGRLGHTTLGILESLSDAHQVLGNRDVAIGYSETVVARSIEVEGLDGFNTTFYRNGLMGLYYEDRQFAKVIPIMNDIVATYEDDLGEDHPYTITAKINLATVYQADGKLADGIAICAENYELAKARGERSREFRYLSRVLANMKLADGNHDESIALGWLASMRTTEGFENPYEWPFVYSTLAELAVGRQDFEKAIEYAEKALTYRDQEKDPDHEYFHIAENVLGYSNSRLGELDHSELESAEELLVRSSSALKEKLERMRHTDYWKLQKAIQRTVDFFDEQGWQQKKEFWDRELEELNQKIELLRDEG